MLPSFFRFLPRLSQLAGKSGVLIYITNCCRSSRYLENFPHQLDVSHIWQSSKHFWTFSRPPAEKSYLHIVNMYLQCIFMSAVLHSLLILHVSGNLSFEMCGSLNPTLQLTRQVVQTLEKIIKNTADFAVCLYFARAVTFFWKGSGREQYSYFGHRLRSFRTVSQRCFLNRILDF